MTSAHVKDAGTADGENRVFWGELENLRNVGRTERWISAAAGVALLGYGLGRRRFRAVLLPCRHRDCCAARSRAVARSTAHWAGTRRGTKGRVSPVASLDRGEGRKFEQAVMIHRPQGELFRFWRRFDNLPRFMDNLESVTILDSRRSHWVAKGPVGTRVEWDAEIHNEIEDELIAWRSLPGADVDQAGSVHFSPAPDGAYGGAGDHAVRGARPQGG